MTTHDLQRTQDHLELLTLEARYADFDSVPAIEAPEDAEIIPLDSLDENNLDAIL